MNSLSERLERAEALLRVIDRSREETGNPELAWNLERMLIDRVIGDLEADSRRPLKGEFVENLQ